MTRAQFINLARCARIRRINQRTLRTWACVPSPDTRRTWAFIADCGLQRDGAHLVRCADGILYFGE